MDETDEKMLDLLKGNARMSYQKLGDATGMSRVAAKKRVQKLEKDGIIHGYNTCIYKPGEITAIIDILTLPDKYDEVLRYVSTRTAYIRQVFGTTKENHIHIVAVSESARDLKYLAKMIIRKCGDSINEIHCHAVTDIYKDVYGGIRYEQKSVSDSHGDNEQPGRSGT